MASGLTSPAGDELARLRRQYDRLCELMTRTAESDPAAAERVLSELQSLSSRILELESAGTKVAEPDVPGESAPKERPAPTASRPPPAPTPLPDQQARATSSPGRIVSLRVTPTVLQQPAQPPAARPSSWRLDPPAPPAPAAPETARQAPLAGSQPVQAEATAPGADQPRDQLAGAKSTSAKAPAATAHPVRPAAEPTAPRAAESRSRPDRPAIVVRRAAAKAAKPAPSSAAAEPPAPKASAQPAAEAPGPAPDRSPVAPSSSSAKVFSSAIRSWLDRHRAELSDQRAAPPAEPSAAATGRPAAESLSEEHAAKEQAGDDGAAGKAPSFADIAAAVERQARQIERLLELGEAHQAALERLEARIAARLDRPSVESDPELPELRQAVREQRQRLTALARTIQNLAQWLAAQRG